MSAFPIYMLEETLPKLAQKCKEVRLHRRTKGKYKPLCVVYQGEDGRIWFREYFEFLDGRFELPSMFQAFVVETEQQGCINCGSGEVFVVKGPDKSYLSEMFMEKDEAFRRAKDLNDAYTLGRKTG